MTPFKGLIWGGIALLVFFVLVGFFGVPSHF